MTRDEDVLVRELEDLDMAQVGSQVAADSSARGRLALPA